MTARLVHRSPGQEPHGIGNRKILGPSDARRFRNEGPEFPWNPTLDDPRKLHNMYARNLITSYVSKFADLSNGLIIAIEKQNFLIYALCGRALLETTAILHRRIGRPAAPPRMALSVSRESAAPESLRISLT